MYAIRPPLPAVGGGEGVGVVTSLGSEVTRLKKGDWVVSSRPGMGKFGPVPWFLKSRLYFLRDELAIAHSGMN